MYPSGSEPLLLFSLALYSADIIFIVVLMAKGTTG